MHGSKCKPYVSGPVWEPAVLLSVVDPVRRLSDEGDLVSGGPVKAKGLQVRLAEKKRNDYNAVVIFQAKLTLLCPDLCLYAPL